MHKYHEMGELAPRDVVARAIAHELEVTKRPDAAVYLDLTHLNARQGPQALSHHLRHLHAVQHRHHRGAGADSSGGALRDGRRAHGSGRDVPPFPGLYAAGEVACTGVHGANRLASNSLLEGLVYGARAARTMRNEMRVSAIVDGEGPNVPARRNGSSAETEKFIQKVQAIMWKTRRRRARR